MSEAPWLDTMIGLLGTQEVRGKRHNPFIVEMFHSIGHPEINDDETSWCAVTVGYCLKTNDLPTTPTDVNMLARSYMTYGKQSQPRRGAIAIWPRGKSKWQGHVNIVEDVRLWNGTTQVRCVGGNQGGISGGDAVTRSAWRNADEALCFRWPVAATVQDLRKAGSSEIKAADTLETIGAVTTTVSAAGAIAKAATETPVAPSEVAQKATDNINVMNALLEAAHGLARFVFQNPWIAVAAVVAIGLIVFARNWKASRIARHVLGLPLSSEAKVGT